MMPKRCRLAREAWSREFDAGVPPPVDGGHLAVCRQCRAFAEAAVTARSVLAARPLPPPNPAADLRVLEALRSAGTPVATVSGTSTFARLAWWLRGGAFRMVGAGAASFVLTLVVAQGLGRAALREVEAPAPEAVPAAAIPGGGYLANRIELWTGTRPPKPEPSPRSGTDARPRRREKSREVAPGGDRAGFKLWLRELG